MRPLCLKTRSTPPKRAKAAGFSVIGVLSEAVEESDRIALQKLCDRCITDYTALLGELLPPEDR